MAQRFRVVLILMVVVTVLLGVGAWRLESEISRSTSFDCTDAKRTYMAVKLLTEAHATPLERSDVVDVELAEVLRVRDAQRVREAAEILEELGPEPDC